MDKDLEIQEEKYLDNVKRELSITINEINESLSNKYKNIIESKKFVWDNFYDLDPIEIISNNQVIDIDLNDYESNLKRKRILEKMTQSPYFARLDFIMDDETEVEKFYIGLSNFAKEGEFESLVYDWRAPISTMFYDYEVGRARYTAPMGEIEGNIEKKVQYKIKNGKLLYMFESSLKIDDEILQKELGSTTDKKMANIVATIQKEQNKVIRSNKNDTLIVQGVAGSGKTSIALHRVAYLLYKYKNKLKSNNVLIISPNKVFSDYISNVLPELGEENIVEMSFDDLAQNELKGISKFESRYDQLEYIIEQGNEINERLKSILNKSSLEFLNYMKEYVKVLENKIFNPIDFSYENFLITKDELKELFLEKYKKIELFKRLDWISDYIIEKIEVDFDTTIERKSKKQIKEDLIYMCTNNNIIKIYEEFLNWIKRTHKLNVGADIFRKNKLFYEDVYPIILFKYYLFGNDDYSYIKHLLVDEMQDYTIIQYEIINKIFKCSKTILGDMNQVINPFMNLKSLYDLQDKFIEKTNLIKLIKSYRSSYEISKFANQIGNVEDIDPLERKGSEPKTIKVRPENIIEKINTDINNYLEMNYTSIAILCKTHEESISLYEKLKEFIDIHLITSESKQYTSGIIITTSYLAKGLEFDVVLIPNVDDDYYNSKIDKQILYISCTRALHELNLYFNKNISALLY